MFYQMVQELSSWGMFPIQYQAQFPLLLLL
jgi:hypothetical protein